MRSPFWVILSVTSSTHCVLGSAKLLESREENVRYSVGQRRHASLRRSGTLHHYHNAPGACNWNCSTGCFKDEQLDSQTLPPSPEKLLRRQCLFAKS